MTNMGKTDRAIRAILGVLLIAAGTVLQILTGGLWWLAIPGAVLLLVSIAAFCPLYVPLHLSTTGKKGE